MLCQLVPACSLPLSRGLSCTGGRNHTTTIIVIFRVIIISLLLGAPWNLIHLLKAISCAIRSVWDSVQLCIWRIATAIKNATDQIVHNHTQLTNDKHPFVKTLKHFGNPLLSLHWKYLNQQLIMSISCNMNVWTNNLLPIWSAIRWLGLGQFWALVCQENYYPHYCTSECRPCCHFCYFELSDALVLLALILVTGQLRRSEDGCGCIEYII